MKYIPIEITPDGSQLIVASDIGQIAVDLAKFNTKEKVEAEILRAIAAAAPAITKVDSAVVALIGKSTTLSDQAINDEVARQAAKEQAVVDTVKG